MTDIKKLESIAYDFKNKIKEIDKKLEPLYHERALLLKIQTLKIAAMRGFKRGKEKLAKNYLSKAMGIEFALEIGKANNIVID